MKTKENKFARQIFVRILACCEVCSKKGKVSSQSEMNVSFFYFGQNLDWGNCSRWPGVSVLKTLLGWTATLCWKILHSILDVIKQKTTVIIHYDENPLQNRNRLKVYFSLLATLVFYNNFIKLATSELGVAQGVVYLTRWCFFFISSSGLPFSTHSKSPILISWQTQCKKLTLLFVYLNLWWNFT